MSYLIEFDNNKTIAKRNTRPSHIFHFRRYTVGIYMLTTVSLCRIYCKRLSVGRSCTSGMFFHEFQVFIQGYNGYCFNSLDNWELQRLFISLLII